MQTRSAEAVRAVHQQQLHAAAQVTLPAPAAQLPVRRLQSPSIATGLLVRRAIICRYSLWRLGEHRIITRAPVHAALQVTPAGPHSAAAVVQAKMEYHGNKAADAEEVTAEELVRWWSAAHIRPGAHVLVRRPLLIFLLTKNKRIHPALSIGAMSCMGCPYWLKECFSAGLHRVSQAAGTKNLDSAVQVWHVGVHSCQLLKHQRFTAQELLDSAAASGLQPVMIWRLVAAVLAQLTGLAPGQYLLTHQPGADAICLFAAATSEDSAAQVCTNIRKCLEVFKRELQSQCAKPLTRAC